MRKMTALAILFLTAGVFAQAPQPPAPAAPSPLGVAGPNTPKGKAPEQGYVPEGWHPHAGSLLKYSVQIRFGEEPETMPEGMKFGRVSAVTTDPQGNVYVFKRDPKTDQLVVFDSKGTYLRSWGKGMFTRPHGLRIDREGTYGRQMMPVIRFSSSRRKASFFRRLAQKGSQAAMRRHSIDRPILRGTQKVTLTSRTVMATRGWSS